MVDEVKVDHSKKVFIVGNEIEMVQVLVKVVEQEELEIYLENSKNVLEGVISVKSVKEIHRNVDNTTYIKNEEEEGILIPVLVEDV